MAAAATAAIAASNVIGGGEYQQARVEVVISRQRLRWWILDGFVAMELGDAVAADAHSVARVLRNLREQLLGDLHSSTPTRPFVGIGRAELAFISASAQGTSTVIG